MQARCDATFEAAGFETHLHRDGSVVNVIGTKRGVGAPEATVVFGAHYDHIPGCVGADDNASGVAAVLELARVLGPGTFARSLVVACWDQEEAGLVGSSRWAAQARSAQTEIALAVSFDAIGFTDPRPGAQRLPAGFELVFPAAAASVQARGSRADFIAVLANDSARGALEVFEQRAHDQDLAALGLRVSPWVTLTPLGFDLRRSDHAPFWDRGWPALLITDTAEFRSGAYHCRERADDLTTLDLAFATNVTRAAAALAVHMLRPVPTSSDTSQRPGA